MDKEKLSYIVDQSLDHLKDFQRKTVDIIFKKLYEDGESKHLVADEVGLGKTIVARGIIARAMNLYFSKRKGSQFRVVYICSNQALAAQNIKKLNPLKEPAESTDGVGRLIFQAFKDDDESFYKLTSLTPSTSFRLIRGSGIRGERLLIYTILSEYKVYTKGRRNNGLKLTLIGHVDDPVKWKNRCDNYKNENLNSIRKEVFRVFKDAVKKRMIKPGEFKYVDRELGLTKPTSLQDILISYSEKFSIANIKNRKYWGHIQILSPLRTILTEICLEYLEADLFILDEFQRFKDLIDTEKTNIDDLSEAAAISKKIFEKKRSKVLMLSATPFKPFTTNAEDENNEEHFKEFTTVLKFLLKDKTLINQFKESRKAFFDLLRRPEKLNLNDFSSLQEQLLPKYKLEEIYRKVISRTERLIVSDDKNTLVRNMDLNESSIPFKIQKQDIDDFKYADTIVKAIDKVTLTKSRSIMDFVLSSPYAFSYLDKYKIKENLNKNKNKSLVRRAIKLSKNGWIDWSLIQKYSSIEKLPNAKFRFLLNEVMKDNLWRQLWISPSLPYYESEGAFKGSKNTSKFLLFSKWVMVPKMIGSLISYEAERRTIGDQRTLNFNEKSRVYTPPMGKTKRMPRHPTKILAIQMKEDKPGKMSAFTILYPCLTFAFNDKFKPINNVKMLPNLSLTELKTKYKIELKRIIEESNISKYQNSDKTTRNWYWAAAVLIDRELHYNQAKVCFDYINGHNSYFISSERSQKESQDPSEIGATYKHFEELKSMFLQPENHVLGKMPTDLLDVMVDIILGSPAICFLRTLTHYFSDEEIEYRFAESIDIASEFHTLFDKPEAIATIQLTSILNKGSKTKKTPVYWKDVLKYSVDGNLQSVLDEYGHLVYADHKDLDSFSYRFYSTININTTNVKVDSAESYLKNKVEHMRCHFAVDFGNQDMDKEEGLKRISNVLNNFNSPFKPFVLASTSIGQEGLDFHYYCRKIVHWNLPSNPIDFEQREGRINRYKGLVIRQNVVKKYATSIDASVTDVWGHLFREARMKEGEGEISKPELVPFWHVEGDGIHIERTVPILPYSKDVGKLKRLLASLTLYRLTFGQPRQEELVESLYNSLSEEEIEKIRDNLMIDLSPISYMK